jgi:hypothetical protein
MMRFTPTLVIEFGNAYVYFHYMFEMHDMQIGERLQLDSAKCICTMHLQPLIVTLVGTEED